MTLASEAVITDRLTFYTARHSFADKARRIMKESKHRRYTPGAGLSAFIYDATLPQQLRPWRLGFSYGCDFWGVKKRIWHQIKRYSTLLCALKIKVWSTRDTIYNKLTDRLQVIPKPIRSSCISRFLLEWCMLPSYLYHTSVISSKY
jgi:hypothetical protein